MDLYSNSTNKIISAASSGLRESKKMTFKLFSRFTIIFIVERIFSFTFFEQAKKAKSVEIEKKTMKVNACYKIYL